MSGMRESHEVRYDDDGTRVDTTEQTRTVFNWFGREFEETHRQVQKNGPGGSYMEQSTYSRKPVK